MKLSSAINDIHKIFINDSSWHKRVERAASLERYFYALVLVFKLSS